MVFGFPIALLGSAAIAGLVATYLYRSRFHTKPVSSLMLWRQTSLPNEGGVRRDRLRLPWLFYLELAALAALVLAAAVPMLRRPPRHTLTVVVDTSASMSARGRDGRRALERAADALDAALRRSPPAAVRVLAAGATVLGIVPPARATALFASLSAAAPSADLGPAIARAAELAGPDGNILVLADRPPPDDFPIRPPLAWIAVGESAPNAAIVYADRSLGADGTEHLLLELRAFGDPSPVNVRLTLAPLEGQGPALLVQNVAFDASGHARLALTLPPGTPDVLAILPEDALAFDNRAVLLAAEPPALNVALCLADEGLRRAVRRAVEASGRAASLREFIPGAWPPPPEPQLVFADAGATLPPRRGWQVRFHAPEASRLVKGPFLEDAASPLLEGVSFQGAVWKAGTNRLDGRALVLADGATLVAFEKSVRAPVLHIQATDDTSTFFRTPAWPALVWNVIDRCAAAQPGPSPRNARMGEIVSCILAADEREAVLETPSGERAVRAANGRAVWAPLEPGLHALRTGGRTMPFAVNLFAEGESDLRSCGRGRWGGGRDARHEDRVFRPVAWAAGLLALVLLVAHHATLSRREARARAQLRGIPTTGGGER